MTAIGKRIIPATCSSPTSRAEPAGEQREYKLRLATPMFGGGARAGQVDPQLPIRASSVRGHLRFWWRLLHRDQFVVNETLDVAALRARESEIWGSTEQPSAVRIRISGTSSEVQPCGTWQERQMPRGGYRPHFIWNSPFEHRIGMRRDDPIPLPYVLFPFTGDAPRPENGRFDEKDGANSITECKFDVCIDWPHLARLQSLRDTENKRLAKRGERILARAVRPVSEEIEASVYAWITWGGIGARTRRGCGAIVFREGQPVTVKIPPNCCLFVGPSNGMRTDSPIVAWAEAVLRLQEFRQTKYRNPGPGRTHWPEPDSIREATGCVLPRHAVPTNSLAVGTFPKAVFGLPIVFHFKDAPRDSPDEGRDPLDVALYPDVGADQEETDSRMASPLVIRPFLDGEEGWCPAVLVLPHDHLSTLRCQLRSGLATFRPGKDTVPNTAITGTAVSSVKPLSDHKSDNALDAFLHFIESQGFRERPLP